jgi:hypothetical protein
MTTVVGLEHLSWMRGISSVKTRRKIRKIQRRRKKG